jgi:hypothetical protein
MTQRQRFCGDPLAIDYLKQIANLSRLSDRNKIDILLRRL